jgi:hypothetical protein
MWKMVDRTSVGVIDDSINNLSYYDLDVENRVHILNSKLKDNYEIYVREEEDTYELMVYDMVLCDFYTEEQEGYRNLVVFWESLFIPTLN